MRLNAIAHAFPPGHRIRLALSPTYWPLGLAVARAGDADGLRRADSRPRAARAAAAARGRAARRFEEPERPPPLAVETLGTAAGQRARCAATSPPAGASSSPTSIYFGSFGSPAQRPRVRGARAGHVHDRRGRPAVGGGRAPSGRSRSAAADWRTRVETTSAMTADAESFHVTNAVDAYEGRRACSQGRGRSRSRAISSERRRYPCPRSSSRPAASTTTSSGAARRCSGSAAAARWEPYGIPTRCRISSASIAT